MAKASRLVWSDHADYATVFPDKLDGQDAFKDSIVRLADKLEIAPALLLAVMEFESGLSATATNPWTGAYGLIQFTEIGLTSIGVPMSEIKSCSAVQQMEHVEAYFAANGIEPGSAPTLSDLYMAILWPPAVGEKESHVLYSSGNYFYETNSVLDTNRDGHVTKAECAAMVSRDLAKFVRPTEQAPAPDDGSERPPRDCAIRFEDAATGASIKPDADAFDFAPAGRDESADLDAWDDLPPAPAAAAPADHFAFAEDAALLILDDVFL